jgi:hypothetical protein
VNATSLLRAGLSRTAIALAVLMLLAVAAARRAPVVESGPLLDFFGSYEVERVRLLGMDLYVDRSAGPADLVTVAALIAATGVLVALAWILRRGGAAQAPPALAGAGLGAAFLAADDALAAHETLGHNLAFLAGLPIIDHPDDLIVGLYALVALSFAWRHRALARGTSPLPWVTAGASGCVAVAHDLLPLHLSVIEEGAEIVATVALLAGVACLAVAQLSRARRTRGPGGHDLAHPPA